MNILLILAIFWPALAGLVIFLTPGCKENKQLRGRASTRRWRSSWR